MVNQAFGAKGAFGKRSSETKAEEKKRLSQERILGEASSSEVASTVKSAADAVGFTPKSPVIEVTGICTHCGKG